MKKNQKLNKELAKQNTNLVKSVDILKKEREILVSEGAKLKSENKSLEKELRKVSSKDRLTKKMSQPSFEENADILKEKIQILEDQLTERDRIATLLKLRLDKLSTDVNDSSELEELERSSSSIRTKNGSLLDSTAALEMLFEEHDTSLRLKRENDDLKSRLLMMEAELDTHKVQRELATSSPKSSRKKSSGFFKRGKKGTSSMPLKREGAHDETKVDYTRSQSPEVIGKSDSHHEHLDISISPLLSHTNKESSVSLPCYGSPNHSPHLPTKNTADAEIITLQSCLKLALEEKNICNEDKVHLAKELDGAKSKVTELEESISIAAEKASAEIEQLKSSLKASEIERDTFREELKLTQHEVDEMVDKNEELDRIYTTSLGEKNKQIEKLEQEIEALKRTKITSPSYNKPPVYGSVLTSPKNHPYTSTAKERLQHMSKDVATAKTSNDSAGPGADKTHQEYSSSEKKTRERRYSVDSPKHEKPGKLFRERSQEKLVKTVPPSPTRKVGRLSRESSIDRFETPTEVKRKVSTSGISSPSLTHSPRVAATRAMFEQKIDDSKTSFWRSSKSSLVGQRRRSSLSVTDMKDTTQAQHTKSLSCDLTSEHATSQEKSRLSTGNASKAKLVTPTTVMEQSNEPKADSNEAKNKINSTHQQQDKVPTRPSAVPSKADTSNSVSLTAAAPTKKANNFTSKTSSETVTKVSRITITSIASPSNSPVLSHRKEIKDSSPRESPSAMLVRNPTSPASLGTGVTFASSITATTSGGQIGQVNSTKVSTVSTTVRHTGPSKAATVSEIPSISSKVHPAVSKSQTESKLQPPSSRCGGAWSSSTHSSLHSTTTAPTTSAVSTNKVVVKMSSRLGGDLFSSANKSGSLQNFPLQVSGSSETSMSPQSVISTKVSTASVPSSGISRGPTHKAMQRRERKDRPKTMYAGNAETTNLVNLITRFQEAEKGKKLNEISATTPVPKSPLTAAPPIVNGTTSPAVTSAVLVSSARRVPPSSGIHKSSGARDKLTRPTSYHENVTPRYCC